MNRNRLITVFGILAFLATYTPIQWAGDGKGKESEKRLTYDDHQGKRDEGKETKKRSSNDDRQNGRHEREVDGKYLSGDFHQHTLYTDGSTPFDFVMSKDNEFGLDWWANSEHGGARPTDGEGHKWLDTAYYPTNPILGDNPAAGNMYRWQSLRDYAFPQVLNARYMYPEKRIFSGLEWNVPAHEHCSTGIVAQDASAISAFEFQFDKSDGDTSRIGESTPYGTLVKTNKTHADAVAGCAWMQNQYENGKIDNGWIVFAHIERAGIGSKGGYDVNHFRDFNNAGPDVCFGFEGAPGHQANPFRGLGNPESCTDGVCTGKDFGGTYGGVGFYTAKVGGLWDALLGEGRHWFNFASSDYHARYDNGGDDFYPGEYQRDWVYAVDKNDDEEDSLNEIADGLRSGNSFFVLGDLINKLDFKAFRGSSVKNESDRNAASMGQTLVVEKDDKITIQIRFKSPNKNNNGDVPNVDHIDLIQGDITGLIAPTDPNYTNATNPSAHVAATFSNFEMDDDGYYTMSYTLKNVSKNVYFRLRGTNLAAGTPNQTDAQGNPLPDALVTLSQPITNATQAAAEAWTDLWFYSNPIFVYVE